MIGSNGSDTYRVKSAAKKDAGLRTVYRTRDCAIQSCLESLSRLLLVAGITQINRSNVPVTPNDPLPVLKMH